MTVQEFYDYCKENGMTDYEIVIEKDRETYTYTRKVEKYDISASGTKKEIGIEVYD